MTTHADVWAYFFAVLRVTGVDHMVFHGHAAACTPTQSHFSILTHTRLYSPLLTPITPLCWQRSFPVPATEKALLLPPERWHAQIHTSPPHSFPLRSHCLFCPPSSYLSPFWNSLSSNELWIIFLYVPVSGRALWSFFQMPSDDYSSKKKEPFNNHNSCVMHVHIYPTCHYFIH